MPLVLVVISGIVGFRLFPKLEPMFPYASDSFWHCVLAGSVLGAISTVYGVFIVPFVLIRVRDFADARFGGRTSGLSGALYIFNVVVWATFAAPGLYCIAVIMGGLPSGSALVSCVATVIFGLVFFLYPRKD